jgi:hypothetical protein
MHSPPITLYLNRNARCGKMPGECLTLIAQWVNFSRSNPSWRKPGQVGLQR